MKIFSVFIYLLLVNAIFGLLFFANPAFAQDAGKVQELQTQIESLAKEPKTTMEEESVELDTIDVWQAICNFD